MDPLTQGLLGAVTAQLGFRQRIGGWGVTWLAAGTAMAADLDIFAGSVLRLFGVEADPLTVMWRYHRGITHSLFVAPIIALLVALPWWLYRRRAKPPPGRERASLGLLFACLCVAAVTHPLLDWCTAYGTQLLAPFSDQRFALNAIAIVDIIYTPILLLTVLACFTARRFRGGQAPRATRVIGWAGLALSTGYLAFGLIVHGMVIDRVTEHAQANAPSGGSIVSVRAYPYLGTVFLWRATVEYEDSWLVARVRPFNGRAVTTSKTVEKVVNASTRAADDLEQVRMCRWFANGQLRAEYATDRSRRIVTLHDMRYAPKPDSVESLWPLRVTFDDAGKVLKIERLQTRKRQGAMGQYISDVWREITE